MEPLEVIDRKIVLAKQLISLNLSDFLENLSRLIRFEIQKSQIEAERGEEAGCPKA